MPCLPHYKSIEATRFALSKVSNSGHRRLLVSCSAKVDIPSQIFYVIV